MNSIKIQKENVSSLNCPIQWMTVVVDTKLRFLKNKRNLKTKMLKIDIIKKKEIQLDISLTIKDIHQIYFDNMRVDTTGN